MPRYNLKEIEWSGHIVRQNSVARRVDRQRTEAQPLRTERGKLAESYRNQHPSTT